MKWKEKNVGLMDKNYIKWQELFKLTIKNERIRMICKDKNWINCQELYKRIGIIGMKGKEVD